MKPPTDKTLANTVAADVMSSAVTTLARDDSVLQARNIMAQRGFRHLPIVDHRRRPLGIVSETDVAAAGLSTLSTHSPEQRDAFLAKVSVENIMRHDPWAVHERTPLAELCRMLVDNRFGSAPVLDDNQCLAGMVTTTDLLRHASKVFESHELTVQTVMRTESRGMPPNTPLAVALQQYADDVAQYFPVVDQQQSVIGVVDAKTLLAARRSTLSPAPPIPLGTTVGQVFVSSPPALSPDLPLAVAAARLAGGHSGLSVVAGRTLVATLDAFDVLRELAARSTPAPRRPGDIVDYMHAPVITVSDRASIAKAARLCAAKDISGLPVVDATDTMIGAITRRDLLRLVGDDGTLPQSRGDELVKDHMTRQTVAIGRSGSLQEASAALLDSSVHRVFVLDHGRPCGVVTARDFARMTLDLAITDPVDAYMSRALFTIDPAEPIRAALSFLEHSEVTGLIVHNEAWPAGVFSHSSLLGDRTVDLDAPVATRMSREVAAVPVGMPMQHAARQLLAYGARWLVCTDRGNVVGLLTATDFVRAVARTSRAA